MSKINEISNGTRGSQPPQASASTNSAIRANSVVTDGISHEPLAPSSDSEAEDKFTLRPEAEPESADGLVNQTDQPKNRQQPFSSDAFGERITGGPAAWCRTANIGAYRELMVASDLMSRGHQVFRNLAPAGIDLIAYINGELVMIEVTTGSRRVDGSIAKPNKPDRCEYDVIAAVMADDGSIHYFNRDDVDPTGATP